MVLINISVVNLVSLIGCQLIWKTLNMVDRLSLSDTDERAKVMPRSRMMRVVGVQNMKFVGLTIGPK
jgi:hypothetical protein